MQTIKAQPGQTWVDLALQYVGDEERMFELCDLNGFGITDEIEPGVLLQCPDSDPKKRSIVNVLKVCSSMFFGVGNPAPEGIEYEAIELDFIVR